jgi:hypothetical protein
VILPDNGHWQCFGKLKTMFHLIRQPILERIQHFEKIDTQDREDGTRIFIQFPNEPEYELVASSENHFYPPASEPLAMG